jgi:uncharacterized protein YxjI
MDYPIYLTFKLIAIANQIYVKDANGQSLGYVKQKLLKLKEQVSVFRDDTQAELLYEIKADRILDFSARYNFTDASGARIGSIGRRGMRSIWKAFYEIFDENGNNIFVIREEKGWIKVLDGIIGELPLVGFLTGMFLNPSYIVSTPDGRPVARLQKEPAFFEGKFRLDNLEQLGTAEEKRILLSVLMMTLLERHRG